MVETAAHLTDHVFHRLPVRQWVLSVPKRLSNFCGAMNLNFELPRNGQSWPSDNAAQLNYAALHG